MCQNLCPQAWSRLGAKRDRHLFLRCICVAKQEALSGSMHALETAGVLVSRWLSNQAVREQAVTTRICQQPGQHDRRCMICCTICPLVVTSATTAQGQWEGSALMCSAFSGPQQASVA